MKKLMMALAFVGLGTVAANAQCDEFATPTTNKYSVATNSFWSNWFVQVGVDMNVTSQYGYGSLLTKDWHDGRSYGIDLALGKWFTPGIGTRLKLNWENGAFAHAFRNTGHVWETPDFHKGGFAAVYFDTEFNLSNIFCGYNSSRVWNLIFFPRMGVIRNFGSDSYAPALGLGFESTWKISNRVGVYMDVAYSFTSNDFIPYCDKKSAALQANNLASVDLGLTVNLGKTGWSKAVSLDDYEALSAEACSKLAALRSQLKSEQNENARLRSELAKWANHKCPGVSSNVGSAATSVFFNINSSKINSKKDIINLEAVAVAAKNTGAKVSVVGAADSKTGSSAYNQKLSEARAQAVADELVSLGVDRAKIEVKGIGGVNDVAPFNLNRRAIITLK
ncbi:MAG: OmpA family protein [Bacteroidaceae bacterium]|nr:OmpA family protein [Bacteroidaceae bacterium]